MPSADPFSPNAVLAAFQRLYPATTLDQLYAHTVLSQPAVEVAGVPEFETDLAAAQDTSRAFLQAVEPIIIEDIVAGALGFTNLLDNMSESLLDSAAAIDAGGEARTEAAPIFLDVIDALTPSLRRQAVSAARLLDQAESFADAARTAGNTLAADARDAIQDPTTADLANQLESIQAQIQADNEVIAKGMSGTVKAEIELGMAMKDLDESPVAGVKAFVGFILDAATQEEDCLAAMADIKTQLVNLGQVYAQFSAATYGVAIAKTAALSAVDLAINGAEVSLAAAEFQIAWMTMRDGLADLASAVSSGGALSTPLMDALPGDLEAWGGLNDTIRTWQQHGAPQPKEVDVEV